jgi:CRP-like cAMP-binding protein
MYFVASGAAEVLLSLAAQPVAVMGPGECFGEMVGTTHPNSTTASTITTTATTACVLSVLHPVKDELRLFTVALLRCC